MISCRFGLSPSQDMASSEGEAAEILVAILEDLLVAGAVVGGGLLGTVIVGAAEGWGER